MPSTTSPADWFLQDVPFTDGNRATPLVDGAAYFSDVKAALENAGASPRLLIAGWRLNPETSIDPGSGQSMRDLITDATSQAGLRTRSMMWYVPGSIGNFGAGHGVENIAFTNLVADLGGEAILDNRLPNGRFASHHQKFMVVGSSTGDVAFVGGIDIAPDRWDDSRHDSSALREPEFFRGWHDVQVKLEGPAVEAVWSTFRERWNDPRRPHNFPAPGGSVPTPIDESERPAAGAGAGTHSVQILKTYACRSNAGDGSQSPYPFAPGGLFTYERGLVRAIDNAEHFVYLEDQYFWPSRVADALADAVARGVVVILVVTRDYDVPAFEPYHNYLRDAAIAQVRAAQVANETVFVFHLEQGQVDPATQRREQIYLHSKTMIVDDRYLAIGSANSNRRSLTTDSELGVAVVDTHAVDSTIRGQPQSVSELARAYRKALWSEHLGSPVADDPLNGNGRPAGFPTTGALVGHIRRHEVPTPRFCQLTIIPFGLMNAKTTCNG